MAEYEYRGLLASTWDLLRGDTSTWPDRAFYRAIIERQRGPALDVGCGTGRLLLDYLAQGLDVDGVDNSQEMLELCRDKARALGVAWNLYQQSMESLDLPRRYATIIVPSASFQLLTDTDGAEGAMQAFHRHLLPGGVLVMSLWMQLWRGAPPPQCEWAEWAQTGESDRPDGTSIRRLGHSMFDHEAQLEHTEYRYEIWRDGELLQTEVHRRSPATRWYTQPQVLALYQAAGFVDVRLTHGFTEQPAAPDDALVCAIGRA